MHSYKNNGQQTDNNMPQKSTDSYLSDYKTNGNWVFEATLIFLTDSNTLPSPRMGGYAE